MKKQTKIRLILFAGTAAAFLIIAVFLRLINNDADWKSLAYLTAFSAVVLAAFFLWGRIFTDDGQIHSNIIIIMVICMLVLIELAFGFKSYGSRMAQFRLGVFNRSLEIVSAVDGTDEAQWEELLKSSHQEEFRYLAIRTSEGGLLCVSDEEAYRTDESPEKALSFVLYSGDRLITRSSDEYEAAFSREILIGQLTLLVTSILFSFEFVIFIIRKVSDIENPRLPGQEETPAILSGLRQVAFLFYFASRLCASFIPTMAKSLPAGALSLSDNMLAGLPQTAETLFVCVSVVFSSAFLSKRGWKTPFLTGLAFILAGSLGCVLAKTLLPFVASRALIGFGYGFCWMTLRSIALLGKNEEQRLMGFSLLNAGLYAGMYCGSTVGSILADRYDYRTVLILSLVLVAACGGNILTMGNSFLPREESAVPARQGRIPGGEILSLLLFVVLMIAPSCIMVSYSSYFLPLFYEELGRSVLDVGRVQLLYGLIIVYMGPGITRLVSRFSRSALAANILYLLVEAGGLILVGLSGSFPASILAMALFGLGDAFGFGVQNSFYMALPINRRFGSSRSLMHLSLIKKLTEMLGPTVFALAMGAGGIGALGILFAALVALYSILTLLRGRRDKQPEAY